VESKAEEYRRKAEEADRGAEEARDLEACRIWPEAAEQWRSLADAVVRSGQ
jgi:hypothetical protein